MTAGGPVSRGETTDRSGRLRALMTLLSERGRLTVKEASDELGVSLATVRRDFTALAEQQLATRTHGGLVATHVSYDLPVRYRLAPDDPKERIARAAADLFAEGDVVGFNGGTTTTAVGRHLGARSDDFDEPVTVVTNALNLAAELVLRDQVITMTTGGVARAHSYELIGPLARRSLDEMWLDWMVLGVDAIAVDWGTGCQNHAEAEINAAMVARAETVVVVADASKLARRAFARICGIDEIDRLITDEAATPADVAALRSAGVDVRTV